MKSKTKKEYIYEELQKEIYEGEYKFNDKLVIDQIAKKFKSSIIPVREAMNMLESDGLIEIKPHVGAIVKPLSEKDLQNIFQIRIELEGLATRLSIENLKEEHMDNLRMILDASVAAFAREEYKRFEQLNIKFHQAIYEKCENEMLVQMIDDLWKNNNRYPSLFIKNHAYIESSIQEHEEIFKALVDRDGKRAEELMIQHKVRAGKEIISIAQRKFYEVNQGDFK